MTRCMVENCKSRVLTLSTLFQANATGLEDDTVSLEGDLARKEAYLSAASERLGSMQTLKRETTQYSTLADRLALAEGTARCSERDYSTICGLGKLRLLSLQQSEVSFYFAAPVPSACILIKFKASDSNSLVCEATLDENIASRCTGRPTKWAASFYNSRIQELCANSSLQSVANPCDMWDSLRQFEWTIGRIEDTAAELTMLQRRYKAALSCANDLVKLDVEFTSSRELAKVVATFEITEAYPFSPVHMGFDVYDGDVDLGTLREIVITNAKPGYGYLSRTCDVIAAFLHENHRR